MFPSEARALLICGAALVELRSAKAEELRELARKFRARAAGCPPGYYHDLILRTAGELEEFADSLAVKDGTEPVIFDDDETIKP